MKNNAPMRVAYTVVVTTQTEFMGELVNAMVISSLYSINNFLEKRNYKNSTVECTNVERMKGITRDHFEITYIEGKDEKSEIVHTFPACCERYISLAREGKKPSVYLTTNHLIHHPKPHD